MRRKHKILVEVTFYEPCTGKDAKCCIENMIYFYSADHLIQKENSKKNTEELLNKLFGGAKKKDDEEK